MIRWEYARLESTVAGVSVIFTHRKAWTGLGPEAFFDTLRRLGDEGWELVTALPLTAALSTEGAPEQAAAAVPAPERQDVRDPRDLRDARYAPEATPSPVASSGAAIPTTLRLTTDRWLMFKRQQPDPPPSPGADMLKGMVGQQLLKGRIPLP